MNYSSRPFPINSSNEKRAFECKWWDLNKHSPNRLNETEMDYIAVVEILTGAEIFAFLRVGPITGIAVPGPAGVNRVEAWSSRPAQIAEFGQRARRKALPHVTIPSTIRIIFLIFHSRSSTHA